MKCSLVSLGVTNAAEVFIMIKLINVMKNLLFSFNIQYLYIMMVMTNKGDDDDNDDENIRFLPATNHFTLWEFIT
jgi:hypothetical protein